MKIVRDIFAYVNSDGSYLTCNYKNTDHFKQNLKIGTVLTSLKMFLWKLFFTHLNVHVRKSVFQELIDYTLSGYNNGYICPPIINPLVISSRYSENGCCFCSSRTILALNCTISSRHFEHLDLNTLAWSKILISCHL